MGDFNGSLNHSSLYGQPFYHKGYLRFAKYVWITDKLAYNPKRWYKKSKLFYPSWGKSLFNYNGKITFTQRQDNFGRKPRDKRIRLMRWRVR